MATNLLLQKTMDQCGTRVQQHGLVQTHRVPTDELASIGAQFAQSASHKDKSRLGSSYIDLRESPRDQNLVFDEQDPEVRQPNESKFPASTPQLRQIPHGRLECWLSESTAASPWKYLKETILERGDSPERKDPFERTMESLSMKACQGSAGTGQGHA
jgi:hypothetical protein